MSLPGLEYGLHTSTCISNNAKLFVDRKSLIKHCRDILPKNPVVAEVGVFQGDFSEYLLEMFEPQKLYLIDTFCTNDFITSKFTNDKHFEYITKKFGKKDNVVIMKGLSWDQMDKLSDESCDFIYIDADHSYESVKKDITKACVKIRNGGIIQFNDYCNFSKIEGQKYGVQDAVNELMKEKMVSILGMSLDANGFHDVSLQIHKEVELNIVTPCIRPENLSIIKDSIDFTKVSKWYIVYDVRHVVFKKQFDDDKIVELACTEDGIAGHQIRNMMLSKISHGMVYFLDDDTVMHPNFWKLDFEYNKIFTFDTQYNKLNVMQGNNPKVRFIDMGQIVFDIRLIGDLRFKTFMYDADGIFIEALCSKYKTNWKYIGKICSNYNSLV
jgi:hypothetical protein